MTVADFNSTVVEVAMAVKMGETCVQFLRRNISIVCVTYCDGEYSKGDKLHSTVSRILTLANVVFAPDIYHPCHIKHVWHTYTGLS